MFRINFSSTAEADLSRLDISIAERILKKLRWLAQNFDSITPERLSRKRPSVFKLRVGDYRVLYTLDGEKQEITVLFVRHRREVYKTK